MGVLIPYDQLSLVSKRRQREKLAAECRNVSIDAMSIQVRLGQLRRILIDSTKTYEHTLREFERTRHFCLECQVAAEISDIEEMIRRRDQLVSRRTSKAAHDK
jgi:hypothetical protein